MVNILTGYAFKRRDGTLLVKTLTDTARGAKVNALCLEASFCVPAWYDDGDIDDVFETGCSHGGSIVKVRVTEQLEQPTQPPGEPHA